MAALPNPEAVIGSPGSAFVFPPVDCEVHLPDLNDAKDQLAKLEILKDSPFINLLNYKVKPNSVATFKLIALMYNTKKSAFCVEGKCLKFCADEAAHILGMKNEGTDFQIPDNLTIPPPPQYFLKYVPDGTVSKSSLINVLKNMTISEDNKVDFKKLVYVYLYNFVFASKSTRITIGCNGFQLVENMESFEKINWVKIMHQRVMEYVQKLEGLEREANPPKKVKLRCFTPLLEAWFYYRTNRKADKHIKDDVSIPPLHFYQSEVRAETLKNSLDPNKFKQRCAKCKDAESTLEAANSEREVVLETPPRPFRIETQCSFEKETHAITEEIGHKVLGFCLEGLMAYASSLGLPETSTELMEMMVDYLNPPESDSWTLVQRILKYKPDTPEEEHQGVEGKQPGANEHVEDVEQTAVVTSQPLEQTAVPVPEEETAVPVPEEQTAVPVQQKPQKRKRGRTEKKLPATADGNPRKSQRLANSERNQELNQNKDKKDLKT